MLARYRFPADGLGKAPKAQLPRCEPACSGRWPRNHERTDWILTADRATGRQPIWSIRWTCHFTRRHRALRGHGLRRDAANVRIWNRHCARSVAKQRDFQWSCAKRSFSSEPAWLPVFRWRWRVANLIRSQLFELNPRDPLTFVGSAIVLTLAAGSAGFISALRASSVDPTTALRDE